MRYVFVSILFLLSSIYACGQPGPTDDMSHRTAEAEAMMLANSGKSDKATDFCVELDYYDDGICDPYCLEPDSDCTAEDFAVMGCGNTGRPCEWDEIAADTDGNGCVDACVFNEDYIAPVYLELGEECTEHEECGDDSYCSKVPGICDGPGVCAAHLEPCLGGDPEANPLPFIICGCDGLSYANACDAGTVGVNILHSGLCGF